MGVSAKDEAAGDLARLQSNLQGQLSNIAIPAMEKSFKALLESMNSDGTSKDVTRLYKKGYEQLDENYGQANLIQSQMAKYRATQSGAPISGGEVSGVINEGALGLQRDYAQAKQNLKFEESQAQMKNFNQVLSMLGQGTQQSFQFASGNTANAANAIGMMNGQSMGGSILGGAASGAAAGSAVAPGWGTAIGALLGGGLGYLGGR